MKKVFIFLILYGTIFSKSISIKIEEGAINDFLSAVGSFQCEKVVDLKLTTMDIIFKISNAKIKLSFEGSKYNANIDIITGEKVSNGTVEGDAIFSFDTVKEILTVDIANMKVRGLDVYDAIGFYKPKYEFPIKIMQKEKIAVRENNIVKSYLISMLYDDEVTVIDNSIFVEANLKFMNAEN